MITKIANNESNQETLNLESVENVKEKLDYYRSLIPLLKDMQEADLEELKQDVRTFFNLKPVHFSNEAHEYLVRISYNNGILGEQNLGFLTNISQLLAPPEDKCRINRCNERGKRVIYCSTDSETVYWETKPIKGDVITYTVFKRKEGAKLNTAVIHPTVQDKAQPSSQLEAIYHLLDDFFTEVFTMPVARDNPNGYLFSAVLACEQLFYPVSSADNIEAIEYPSVQRKMNGHNIAIKNDLILDRYIIESITTRWIIDELPDVDPQRRDMPIDDLISSIEIKDFDCETGEIKYPQGICEKFVFLRYLQMLPGKQTRFKPGVDPQGLLDFFHLQSSLDKPKADPSIKLPRNHHVTVMYLNNGPVKKNIKFKFVKEGIKEGLCLLIKQ